ncbi:MAG: M48 family metalloprotease [Pseudomonadota bacterium]
MKRGLLQAIGRRVLAAVLLVMLSLPAAAQGLVRDAEIEATLKRIADPILRAAGLSPSQVTLYIVSNPRLNAFVAGGNNIFIHTGLFRRLEGIDEIRAVIAHETGHITGGHVARRNQRLRTARGIAGLGVVLSVAAVAAGAPQAGIGLGIGAQEAALRDFLAHTRAEEAAADQASLRYMVAAGADPTAITRVMKLFSGQEILSGARQDPYVRTHPLWRDRLRYLEDRVASAPRGQGPSQLDAYWHARLVAKFDGFLGNPSYTLRKYKDDRTEIGALARAVAYHRLPDIRRSMQTVDGLLSIRPNDPFYNELKGQFLLENGDAAGATAAYRRAVSLAPREALIQAGLGRALVARGGADREALDVLERARALDPADPRMLRDLAVAYARNGQAGRAALASAERFALLGRLGDAKVQATRAAGQLPEGSAAWRRAQDIIAAADRGLR